VIKVHPAVGHEFRTGQLHRDHPTVDGDDGAAEHHLADAQAHQRAEVGVQVGPDSQSHAVTVGRDRQDREVDGGD
jgi:hypothetical protein